MISLLGDDRMVRYVGDAIAAVAANDRKTALAALAAIRMTSEALPSAIGLDAARKTDAPVVFEKSSRKRAGNVSEGAPAPAPWNGNVRGPSAAFSQKGKKAKGWIAAARDEENPWLVEATFRTGTQSHACLEPHATVARFDGDRLTVHASTQSVFHVMELIAKRYKLGARQDPRHRRSRRRRFWLQGHARHGDHCSDRTRARSQGAGPDRL